MSSSRDPINNDTTTIQVTEYLLPNGHQITRDLEVDIKVAERSKEMVLSCEMLLTGKVTAYARFKDQETEDEDLEIFENQYGNLRNHFETLINRVYVARFGHDR